MQEVHDPPVASQDVIRRPIRTFSHLSIPRSHQVWFSKAARLEAGQELTWEWSMYNFSVPVNVKAVDQNARILVEWSAYGAPTPIEWIFTARPDGTTFVSVTNSCFPGSEAEVTQHALHATEGLRFSAGIRRS
jgi:uncharacterized protein YndB with AHSA1/START domain